MLVRKIPRACICLLLLVVLVLNLLPTAFGADAVRNRKIVSLVYDDSGSMTGDKWAYTSYAIQAFCAMLNKEDDLYITFMTDPEKSVSVSTQNPNAAVQMIRDHASQGSTPAKSLETAVATLSKIQDTNPNTQFWLVVFTDGEFDEQYGKDRVQSILEGYRGIKMPNGTTPQITFMTIGDKSNSFTPAGDANNGITVARALDSAGIVSNLFAISSQVSGRLRAEDGAISLAAADTIEVNTDTPLLNIGIIAQQTPAKVVSVTAPDQRDVPIKTAVEIQAPDNSNTAVGKASPDATGLHGFVALVGRDSENLPAGHYKIKFDAPIDKKDLIVMLEPAIELRIKLFIDGAELTDLSAVSEGVPGLSAEAFLYEFGTNNVILPSLLPGRVQTSITHELDGNVLVTDLSLKLNDLQVKAGKNTVRAVLDLPGMYHLEDSVSFEPLFIHLEDLSAEPYFDGSERLKHSDNTVDGNDVVYISRLKTNRTGVKFIAYENGVPLSHDKALVMKEEFRAALSSDIPIDLEVLPDGGFLAYPSQIPFIPYLRNGIIYWLYHVVLFGSRHTISADIGNLHAEGSVELKIGELLKDLIWFIIIIYIIIWVIFKRHFPKMKIIYSKKRDEDEDSPPEMTAKLNWLGGFDSAKMNIFYLFWKLIAFVSLAPAAVELNGFRFSSRSSINEHKIRITGVRGKEVFHGGSKENTDNKDYFDWTGGELSIKQGTAVSSFLCPN